MCGFSDFSRPCELTTAVLCANVLNSQEPGRFIRRLLTRAREVYQKVTHKSPGGLSEGYSQVLEGLSESYCEVTIEYLGGYYGVTRRFNSQ